MGWLFGKKDDGLYRGDAPASAPGFDGVEPAAYQGSTPGQPYDLSAIGRTPAPYAPASAAYPTTPTAASPTVASPTVTAQPYAAPASPGQVPPLAAGQPSAPVTPPALANAMAYVQNQQRGIKRSLTRMLIGFLVPLVFLGGLVVTGFVVYNNFEDEINDVVNSDVFNSGPGSDPGPAEPVDGVVGTLAEVTLGENSYDITIESATP